MRQTPQAWWCGRCQTRNSPDCRVCLCGQARFERHAQVHASDRAVVFYNPATGEHRTPARADTPLSSSYAAAGFERREIMNMTAWEKESGTVHEATNFNPGNEMIETPLPEPKKNPEAMKVLTDDIRAAIASGPWTGFDKLGGAL